jgi:hypothetical protein
MLGFSAAALCADGGRGRNPAADPALAMRSTRELSVAEAARVDLLMEQLLADDFDRRRAAKEALIALGPAALQQARKQPAKEIGSIEAREFLRALESEVAQKFHGYLPTSPDLKAALQRRQTFSVPKGEPISVSLQRLCREAGLRPPITPQFEDGTLAPEQETQYESAIESQLLDIAESLELRVIARGNALVLTEPANIATLRRQHHVFADARLQDDELELLRTLLGPRASLEQKGAALHVTGPEGALRAAARGIGLLRSSDSVCQWPAPVNEEELSGVLRALRAPLAAIDVEGVEGSRALQRLEEQGVSLVLDDSVEAYFNTQQAVSLRLKDAPLGLALTWLALRANMPPSPDDAERLRHLHLYWESQGNGPVLHAALNLESSWSFVDDFDDSVGCVNIAPLLERTPQADLFQSLERFKARLAENLEVARGSDPPATIAIFHKKAYVRGTPLAVHCALETVKDWIAAGKTGCNWRENLEAKLAMQIDWNGDELTPGSLIARLNEATGLNLLLVRENPEAAFGIAAADAPLLPPGKRTPRALFDRLSTLTGAPWHIERGAVVFTPESPARHDDDEDVSF